MLAVALLAISFAPQMRLGAVTRPGLHGVAVGHLVMSEEAPEPAPSSTLVEQMIKRGPGQALLWVPPGSNPHPRCPRLGNQRNHLLRRLREHCVAQLPRC